MYCKIGGYKMFGFVIGMFVGFVVGFLMCALLAVNEGDD